MRLLVLAMGAWALTAVVPLAAQTSAPAGEARLALVIGNATYTEQALRNPTGDARAVAASLRALGFSVIERTDVSKKAMEDAILEFGERLRTGGIGLFYYAGHGIQARGVNYLVPVDAKLTSEASARVQAVDVNLVLDLMADARNRANIVILDACRNNPFSGVMRGASRGLAAIDAARGTLIAYSTAPGRVASDGQGQNSPYTAALVSALAEPGLKAEDLFKRVRTNVVENTSGAQVPWESSSLTGDLVLNINITVSPAPAAQAAAPTPAPVNRDAVEVAFWNTIVRSTDPRDFEEYLRQFPEGAFAGLAKRRVEDMGAKTQQAALPPPTAAPAKPEPTIRREEKPALVLDPVEREFVATQAARVRETPELSGKQVAALGIGQAVQVRGKVRGENWFQVERDGKPLGFVAATLLEDAAIYRAREEERRKARAAEEERKKEAARAKPAPAPSAAPSIAALPPSKQEAPQAPPPAPSGPTDINGHWSGESGSWRIELDIQGREARGKLICKASGTHGFSGAVGEDGRLNIEIRGLRLETRQLTGTIPALNLTPGGNCGGAKFALRR